MMAPSQRKKELFITTRPEKKPNVKELDASMALKKAEARLEDPYVVISEQPATDNVRFYSEVDDKTKPPSSIPGVTSTPEKKTYPAIGIRNFDGDAVVVVSCVSGEEPHRAHPHKLVWREGKTEKGVCSANVKRKDMTCELRGLSIDYVKKIHVKRSLEERRQIRVDPFKQGFEHMDMDINLSAVRLCFQVFLKLTDGSLKPLKPVVSHIIKDKKRSGMVQILEISDTQIPAEGNKKVLFFCDRMQKSDMELKVLEKNGQGQIVWSHPVSQSQMKPSRFGGVSFIAPPYQNCSISEPVKVQLILTRLSDQKSSEPVSLVYVPSLSNVGKEVEGGDDITRGTSTFSVMNMDGNNPPLIEDFQSDHRMMTLKSSLNTLTKVLEAEKEANRLLTQRTSSLQSEMDSVKTDLKVMELELKTGKEDKGRVQDKNELLQGQVRALELKCMELEHSRAFGSNESFLATLSQEREINKKLTRDIQKVGLELAEMRFQMKEQEQGVLNMQWQLEQKREQVLSLEKRLQETFPLASDFVSEPEDEPPSKQRRLTAEK